MKEAKEFTLDTMFGFPVYFNNLWKLLDYKSNEDALATFFKMNFTCGKDYQYVKFLSKKYRVDITDFVDEEEAIRLFKSKYKNRLNKEKSIIEHAYSDALANVLPNAKREVKCELGFIDILSDNYIVEVKQFSQWKHALGQILVYGSFHEHLTKVLFLYKEPINKNIDIIKNVCSKHNVEVWLFNDLTQELKDKLIIEKKTRKTNEEVFVTKLFLSCECVREFSKNSKSKLSLLEILEKLLQQERNIPRHFYNI